MLTKRNLLLSFCLMFCLSLVVTFKATASPIKERLGGVDRYETSIKVSKDNWSSSDNVIVVSGQAFPDALCATPLAKKYNDAPILLTAPNNLSESLKEEIIRLGAKNIFIVGGPGAVSPSVEQQITQLGKKVTRIQGKDRYETSTNVAKFIGGTNGVVIASGEGFADALSIAPIAATKQMPILLTSAKVIPTSVKNYLSGNNIVKSYVVGGQGVISDTILNSLSNGKRLSGNDRYQTNSAIIKEFQGDINFDNLYVSTGEGFADALSGSAAAAKVNSVIVLANGNYCPAQDVIRTNIDNIKSFKILGGTAVVSDSNVQKILIGGSIKVCIDAGHGGYDSGAVGPTGLYEKNVNLAVALKTGKILEQNGIDVIYTREDDNVSWPSDVVKDLQKRCDIANAAGAKYFICIHSNSNDNPQPGGTETYYLAGSVEGQKLAQSIQKELVKSIGLYDRGLNTANFYVLRNTNMPAILAELAFISNPKEENLLANTDFQNKCAQGIASGVLKALGK